MLSRSPTASLYSSNFLERLSGNSGYAPLRGPTSLRNEANRHLLCPSRDQERRQPTRTATFQTVSGKSLLRHSDAGSRIDQRSCRLRACVSPPRGYTPNSRCYGVGLGCNSVHEIPRLLHGLYGLPLFSYSSDAAVCSGIDASGRRPSAEKPTSESSIPRRWSSSKLP